jgi:molybdopterin molybdotransferase
MDGFAVRAADCGPGTALTIAGYMPGGPMPNPAIGDGVAIKIMTGAPIPGNCDAVVPFEAAEEINGVVRHQEALHTNERSKLPFRSRCKIG